jgi:Ig-like domain from next to BRCA1 gene
MKTQNRFAPFPGLLAIIAALFLIAACTPTPTPTLFIAPRAATATPPFVPGETPVIPTLTPQPVATSSPTATPPCMDGLTFVQDVTVPDGTVVSPGASIDKQWLVQNSGTCNWDSRYRLKFVGGQAMVAEAEQALYPARAGSQATISMAFTAPSEPGTYTTAWQAINPDGEAFGDPVFMEVTVQVEAQVTLEIIDGGQ